ncbi:hypothetical protein XF30_30680 [Bradyrhizobium sp. SUTN9-2]|nr:hypothetical protein XF30_30680 [Bradyrhizobium sp. SUTN9-2]
MIDRSSALRFIFLIERERREEFVDILNQFGVQSFCAYDCLTRVVALQKAEYSDGSGSRYPMAVGTLVIRLAIVLIDHQLGRHPIQLKPKL